jgi:kynurenine formamidase
VHLFLDQRVTVGCFPWRFVDGGASTARAVAFVEVRPYGRLMVEE